MVQRVAASLALITFVICLVAGGLQAGNPFATTVWRALIAMGATFLLGLIVGSMAQKMLDENLSAEEKKLKNSQAKTSGSDR
jgi:hypothetical protein